MLIKFLFDTLTSRKCNFVNCLSFIPFHFHWIFYINFIDSPLNYNSWQKEIFQGTTNLYILVIIVSLCQMHLSASESNIWYTRAQIFFHFLYTFTSFFLYVVCSGKEKCLAVAWYWSFWPCKKKNKSWNPRVCHVGEPKNLYLKIIKFPCEMCPLYQLWMFYYIIKKLFFMLEKQWQKLLKKDKLREEKN